MFEPDFIPKDGKLCARCIYYDHCPMEFSCKTLDRMLEHYGKDFWSHIIEEDEENVHNGNSTKKVR